MYTSWYLSDVKKDCSLFCSSPDLYFVRLMQVQTGDFEHECLLSEERDTTSRRQRVHHFCSCKHFEVAETKITESLCCTLALVGSQF